MKTISAANPTSSSRATAGSHHAASPSSSRIGMRIADTGGTNDPIVRAVPSRKRAPKYMSSMSVVIGVEVDCRSSVREASAPATAHRQARARKPTTKNARNHPTDPEIEAMNLP